MARTISKGVGILALVIIALALGVGVRYVSGKLLAASDPLEAALNPSCTADANCLLLSCGTQSFTVKSSVPFSTVDEIRKAWCSGAPLTGIQNGAVCSSYHECVPRQSGAPTASTASAVDVLDLAITSAAAYPNISSVILTWGTNAPAAGSATVTGGGQTQTYPSELGEGTDHVVHVYGLLANTTYTYTVSASAHRGLAVQQQGTFTVLPRPSVAQ